MDYIPIVLLAFASYLLGAVVGQFWHWVARLLVPVLIIALFASGLTFAFVGEFMFVHDQEFAVWKAEMVQWGLLALESFLIWVMVNAINIIFFIVGLKGSNYLFGKILSKGDVK